MKKEIIISIIFLNFVYFQVFSQEPQEFWEWEFEMTKFDSLIHEKIYRISIENNQQVELIRLENGNYQGHLNNVVWTTNKKEIRKKRISQVIKIPDSIVRKLFVNLENSYFEKIPDCIEIDGCISGFDGETTFYTTETEKNNKTVSFWELTNDYYYNENIPLEVLKAQNIMGSINHEFNLKEEFNEFTSRLPNGKYIYSSLILKIKKKNVW